jgi:hypothetical protein
VLLQTVVTLVNLGGQRLGLSDEARDLRDLDQTRVAIDAVRALLPLLEAEDAEQVRPIRDALAQLQMAYAREVGSKKEPADREAPSTPAGRQAPSDSRKPSSSGRLWVPPGSAT